MNRMLMDAVLLLRVFVSLLVWDVFLTASLHLRMFTISVEM